MPENSNPREGQADGLQDGRDRSALMKLARWLGRLPLVVATSILVLGTTVIATLAVFVLLQSGASTDTPDIYFFAAGITILVSWPIIHSAQKLIRELRGARETERRMAERLVWALDRAERANDEKSRFLATMSHELRTPLNAVIGFSDMIMSERLGPMNNPRYRDYAGDINSSGLHLLGIINEILDLAKIEAGKMHIDEDAICDIRDAIGKASMMVAPQAPAPGRAGECRCPGRRPAPARHGPHGPPGADQYPVQCHGASPGRAAASPWRPNCAPTAIWRSPLPIPASA